MSGWIEPCHNLAQMYLIAWIALRRITQPSTCGLQSTWRPGHSLVFQAHLAPSCPTSFYITYFSLTTPNRYYSVHLREHRFCGFCVTLYKTVLDFSVIYTDLPSWTFQNAGPWLRQNQLQTEHNNIHHSFGMCLPTDGFHALRPRNHNVTNVFPETFGFSPMKWVDNLQKVFQL